MPKNKIEKISQLPEINSKIERGKYLKILEDFLSANIEYAMILNVDNLYNAYHGLTAAALRHKYPVRPSCRHNHLFLRRITDERIEEKTDI